MDITNVIDGLILDCKETLPDTQSDKKPNAQKEGMIGRILSGLMTGRFRRFHDALMVFNGIRYELLDPNEVRKIVMGFLVKMGVGDAYLSRSVGHIHKMVMDNPFLRNYSPKRNVIFMKNCVLVLGKDGDIVQESPGPQWMSDIYLDFPYVPFAKCPKWEEFLSVVTDDGNAVKVIQEFLGCMFVDKNELSVEKALFLYGHGSNGKSVVFETLQGMLGTNLINAGLDQINGSSGDYFTADLVGKLLSYNSDAEAKDISSGKYKQLISKEKIMVRSIRQAPFESDDWPMFMANINKGIITTDSSNGFWRRNIVVGFFKRFSDNPDFNLGELKADRSFKNSMRDEYPGIFNWILLGRQRILRQGGVFTRSRSIEELTEDMKAESTGVFSFLRDKGYVGRRPDFGKFTIERAFARDMYIEYKQWCAESGYKDIKNMNRFKGDMENAGITYKKSMKMDGRVSSGYIYYKVEFSDEKSLFTDLADDEDLPE